MRVKLFLLSFLAGLMYFACEDTTNMGIVIQPGEDKIIPFDTTITITASTIKVDSIYAKTINGCIGEIYDPSYGTINAGFACQFYPSVGFQNIDSIVNDRVDSVFLSIHYNYLGDSLAPMELTVFPVVKPLEKNYYTNVDPATFCDLKNPIVKYGYTARNMNIPDTLLSYWGYDYELYIPLPLQLGQDFLEASKNDSFKNLDDFLKFFPGLYLASTFGTGSLIFSNTISYSTEIHFHYKTTEHTTDTEGNDSIIQAKRMAVWAVTKEVIQLNSYKNTHDDFLLQASDSVTYMKSPAGFFTELTIPTKEIAKGVGKRQFSSVTLSISAYPISDWEYSLGFPGTGQVTSDLLGKVLLIKPDSVKNFFEQQQLANNRTSFSTVFTNSTYSYHFTNIANVVQDAIENNPEEDLKLWLIPVQTSFVWTTSSTTGEQIAADYATSHYLYPSGVALKKGGDNLKIRIIASNLQVDN
jgi:hypothetical protein